MPVCGQFIEGEKIMARKNPVDKNSVEYLQSKVNTGRHSLLLILAFTVVNLLMVVLDSSTYFLFSASVPYYLTLYAKGIDNDFVNGPWTENGPVTIVALIVSAVILLLFLLCWLLSRKRTGWLVPALVLFILDTLALAWCTLNLVNDPAGNLVDFVFHFWAIWELIQAIRCGSRLKKLPARTPDLDQYYHTPEIEE